MDLLGGIFIMLVVLLVTASISLGLLIAIITGRRRDTIEQRRPSQTPATTDANASQDDMTQLDRIEAAVNRATLSSTRLGVLAIAIAAVIFAGTGLEVDIWARVLVFVGGLAGIFLSRYVH